MKHSLRNMIQGLVLVIGLWAGQAVAQHVGGGKEIPPPDPAFLEMNAKVGRLFYKAHDLVREAKYVEALAVFQESLEIELGWWGPHRVSSGTYYWMAKIHQKLGNRSQALDAYRLAFKRQTYAAEPYVRVSNGALVDEFVLDYALLLNDAGRHQDAKVLYYSLLRNLTGYGEPFPFVVVFDQDAEGEVWEFTPQNLEAALLMARTLVASTTHALPGDVTREEARRRVRELKPDWAYPLVQQAWATRSEEKRNALFDQAEALARTPAERDAIRKVRTFEVAKRPASEPDPVSVRANLRVLKEGVQDLLDNYKHLYRPVGDGAP
jgi:tetratricopeptide (TPR) repeat protein